MLDFGGVRAYFLAFGGGWGAFDSHFWRRPGQVLRPGCQAQWVAAQWAWPNRSGAGDDAVMTCKVEGDFEGSLKICNMLNPLVGFRWTSTSFTDLEDTGIHQIQVYHGTSYYDKLSHVDMMLKCSFATTCHVTYDTYLHMVNQIIYGEGIFLSTKKEDFLLLLVTRETSLEQDGS